MNQPDYRMYQENDTAIIAIVERRMTNFDPSTLISLEEMNQRLEIEDSALDDYDDVEFE